MAKYTLSADAEGDVARIMEYTVAQHGIDQARSYYNSIHQAAQLAADFPNIGRPYVTRGGASYRIHNVARHALFYEQEPGGILISRVLHLIMDFDRHLDRDRET